LAVVSLTVLISVGSVVLVQLQGVSFTETQVQAEADSPATPLPTNFTLDESTSQGFQQVAEDSVTVVLEDGSSGTNTTLTSGTDFEVFRQAGQVELQSTPAGVSYNSTEDTVFTDYTAESTSQASETLGQGNNALDTFGQFLQVVVVVAVAGVIFLLLGGLRRAGGRTMA